MKNWTKLTLPVGLGLAAACAHGLAVYSKIAPSTYIVVTRDIVEGEPVAAGDLAKIELYGDQAGLPKTVLPFAQRAMMYGQIARRDFSKGDLVLWQDTKPAHGRPRLAADEVPLQIALSGKSHLTRFLEVGQNVSFLLATDADAPVPDRKSSSFEEEEPLTPIAATSELVGPFRVVAIGSRVEPGDIDRTRNREEIEMITVAAKLVPGDRRHLDPVAERLQMAASGRGTERVYDVIVEWKKNR
jgi:hypothetical protein